MDCLSQALGASQRDFERQVAPSLNNFIALGDLKALTADQGAPPLLAALASAYGRAGKLQGTILSHRFPLASGELPKVLNFPTLIQRHSKHQLSKVENNGRPSPVKGGETR